MSEDARNMFVKMLMKKYGHAIEKIAMEILNDPDILDDIKQEVFSNCAFQKELLEAKTEDQILAYICTSTKNVCYNEIRRRVREQRRGEAWLENYYRPLALDQIDFTRHMNDYGFSDETTRLLERISDLDKDILVLRFFHGYDYNEIAEILNMNAAQLRKRLQRSKDLLVELIKEGGVEDETL